jgi:hypothetical protein
MDRFRGARTVLISTQHIRPRYQPEPGLLCLQIYINIKELKIFWGKM